MLQLKFHFSPRKQLESKLSSIVNSLTFQSREHSLKHHFAYAQREVPIGVAIWPNLCLFMESQKTPFWFCFLFYHIFTTASSQSWKGRGHKSFIAISSSSFYLVQLFFYHLTQITLHTASQPAPSAHLSYSCIIFYPLSSANDDPATFCCCWNLRC
jgi:hypothetical protein